MHRLSLKESIDLALEAGYRLDYAGVYLPAGVSGYHEIDRLINLSRQRERAYLCSELRAIIETQSDLEAFLQRLENSLNDHEDIIRRDCGS